MDGVILFSDILTPLPTMGINFDITENGKIQIDPIRTRDELRSRLKLVTQQDYEKACGFVGDVLQRLSTKIGIMKVDKDTKTKPTLLGFVGLPFTLVTYLVEGETGIKSNFANIHQMIQDDPSLLKHILSILTDNIIEYACYQISNGAQIIQVFDSWAGHVNDENYDKFALPYQQKVINGIKRQYPNTPIIIYMAPGPYSENGQRLTKLIDSGADVISVDHTIDMEVACKVIPSSICIQGNLNPQILRDGPLNEIKKQTLTILDSINKNGRKGNHIMNLGHGILPDTPEEHVKYFVELVQQNY